jgi:hypothetical protein
MDDVFIKRSAKSEPGFSIGVTLKKKPVAGSVGIEIEVEGKKLPNPLDIPSPWVYKEDHSLRGEENAEYVVVKPIEFNQVDKALDNLWAVFKKSKTVLDDSNRTSVHVHLNCTDFHLNRLTSFMALYYTMEEVLTEWCGEHRVGNLFCLRAVDAPAIISQVKKFIKYDGEYKFSDNLHYSGLNPQALYKFGSLEIRTLRGCSDQQVIKDWVGVLGRLYNLSEDYPDPRDICGMFSMNGPLAFFYDVLGPYAQVIRNGVTLTDDQIRDCMYAGVRLAQDLCYCRDWGTFKPVQLKPDPFGRDPKKIMKKMVSNPFMGMEATVASATQVFMAGNNPSPIYQDTPPNWGNSINIEPLITHHYDEDEED